MKLISIVLFACTFPLFSQTDFESNHLEKATLAKDQGEYYKAIDHYNKLVNKYPERLDYLYEKAMCYYRLREYGTASSYGEILVNRDPTNINYFRMLGNSYELNGAYSQAMDIFRTGNEQFPYDGDLYLDMGIIEMLRENVPMALEYWELGISAEPLLKDNYYWAAKTYAGTDEKIWSLLYGEIFLNLEKSSDRFNEISELLFDQYIEFVFEDQGTYAVHLSRGNNNELKSAFERIYQMLDGNGLLNPTIGFTPQGKKRFMEPINFIRKNFIELWEQMYAEEIRVKLFEFHREMIDNGYFSAYNHWLMINGDPDYFIEWMKGNEVYYTEFIGWFISHPYHTNIQDYFVRFQYEIKQ